MTIQQDSSTIAEALGWDVTRLDVCHVEFSRVGDQSADYVVMSHEAATELAACITLREMGRKEIARLRAALAYYADVTNWTYGDVPGHIYAHDDAGEKARRALSGEGRE